MKNVAKSLDELTLDVVHNHEAILHLERGVAEEKQGYAVKAGKALLEVKDRKLFKPGTWPDFIKHRCRFSMRTAQRYMYLAENHELIPNPPRVADLNDAVAGDLSIRAAENAIRTALKSKRDYADAGDDSTTNGARTSGNRTRKNGGEIASPKFIDLQVSERLWQELSRSKQLELVLYSFAEFTEPTMPSHRAPRAV